MYLCKSNGSSGGRKSQIEFYFLIQSAFDPFFIPTGASEFQFLKQTVSSSICHQNIQKCQMQSTFMEFTEFNQKCRNLCMPSSSKTQITFPDLSDLFKSAIYLFAKYIFNYPPVSHWYSLTICKMFTNLAVCSLW